MLESITLKNFQKHENLTIDFDPGVTTIIGTSDVGKSAAIRALTWLAQNKLRGDAFIRRGAKSAEVVLNVAGRKIERVRGKENLYRLDGEEYKAVSSTCPEDVADVLNVNVINFQQQHDPPFLFSSTPGQVATALNQVVDLTIIDSTLKNLNAANAKARNKVELYAEEKENNENLIKSLEGIVGIDEELSALEDDLKQLDELEDQIESITKYGKFANEKKKQADQIESVRLDFTRVENSYGTITTIKAEIKAIEGLIAEVDEVNTDFPFDEFDSICEFFDNFDKEHRVEVDIKMLVDDADRQKRYEQDAAKKAEELIEVMGVCPTCGK